MHHWRRMSWAVLGILFVALAISGAADAATYYVAKTGSDSYPGTEAQPWLTITKAANTLVAGDTVYVKAGTYSEAVYPQNSGTAGNYITYSVYPGAAVNVDCTNIQFPTYYEGCFTITGKSYIKVIGFNCMNARDGFGIVAYSSSNVEIRDNYTYNSANSGIAVWAGSHDVIVQGNEVELACNDLWQECISVADGSYNVQILNNEVHHSGPGSEGGEGIDVKEGSHDVLVKGNHVHHINRLGLYCDAWDQNTYNVTYDSNVVHDCKYYGMALACERGKRLDHITIMNNVFYDNTNSGICIGDWDAGYPHPMDDVKIINNTCYGNGTGSWGTGVWHTNVEATNVVIRNNIFSQNNSHGIYFENNCTGTIDHNLFDGATQQYGTSYITGDPKFVAPASFDFHLQSNSPAIDQGSSVSAPDHDYEDDSRPDNGLWDMGADEYISGPQPPVANFYGSPTSGAAPLTVYFTDTSSGSPTSWSWTFGDGGTSTAQNPSHQYTASGYYTVGLTATNAYGQDTEIKTNYIGVEPAGLPTVVAAGAVASGTGTITPALPSGIATNDILLLFVETANQACSISNQNGGTWAEVASSPQGTGTAGGTSATRVTVFWSRYNGTQGAPTVSDSGNHQLGRILAFRGCATSGNPWDVTAGGVETTSDTSGAIPGATTTVDNCLVVAAIATDKPDAAGTENFSAWANSGLTIVTELTDDTVSKGNGGGLAIARGGKASAGAYGATAVTCGTAAVKGMMSIALKAPGGAPQPPVANFSGNPTSGYKPLTVAFTDLSTNSPTSWSWAFGDGGTSTSQNPSHQYTSAGQYTVTLTATNAGGSDDETKTNYITVSNPPAPVANFTGSPTSGYAPLTVNFTDTSTNSPTSWSWTFGDGGTSTAQNPSHQYTSAGQYTVTLTATNASGSDDETKTNYITVSTPPPAPVADFSGSPTSGNAPLTVNFTDLSTNNPTSWSWTFGDGGTSTAQNPSHQYTSAGNYTVSLTATNAGGSDGETKTNYITVSSTSQQIFFDGFESAFNWYKEGSTTWYTGTPKIGTHSVQMQGNSCWTEKGVSTVGYSNIVLRVYVGASSYEASEQLDIDYYDGSWHVLRSIRNGDPEEDGQLHFLEFSLPSSCNNKSTFKVGFGQWTADNTDYGYIDSVEVRGTP